jgi:hypothetical protein
MCCKNCHEPIVDESDENDPAPEWVHRATTFVTRVWLCPDDSGNHAEPEED